MDFIRIRGARTHNLKNINLDLPARRLIVVTGLSGSGKSSLAFDTLYAEGQRRYVESLSAYARQFLQLMEKPDVDLIEGLSPAISIEQKVTSHNPRSTVGTVTEIHDYLRLLFARIGEPQCPEHGINLSAQSVTQMVDHALALPEGTRLMILAPCMIEKKGEQLELFEHLRAQGFSRVRINKKLYELDLIPALNKNQKHNIEVVIDRIKIRQDVKSRLAESFETALVFGHDRVLIVNMDNDSEQWFSATFSCPLCAYSLPELEPRLFSFNSPMGACQQCDGLGEILFFDPKRIASHPELSLADGAIGGWDRRNTFYFQMLKDLANHYHFDVDTPFEELNENIRTIILYGSGAEKIQFLQSFDHKMVSYHRPFEGIVANFERRYLETDSIRVREELAKYQHNKICPSCDGTRLKKEARHVQIGGKSLTDINALPLKETASFFASLVFDGQRHIIAEKIIKELNARIAFLNDVGLGYLSLSRAAETLSGGESQRIRLASQIGSGLTGVMYVLDEPSIGLHQRDNQRLIATLLHLRDLGNSVIMVEHDEEAICHADFIVDMGPGAGEHGGEVLIADHLEKVKTCSRSITGAFLSGRRHIALPKKRLPINRDHMLLLYGASGNNLKNLQLDLPLGLMVCVTGVSGSGKSTLINDTLFRAVFSKLHGTSSKEPAPFTELIGTEQLDKIINVDQSPIGRTPRSNPATYTGMFTPIRELFAGVPLARERGYNIGRFSFNVKGGRCEACQGDGLIKVEMHFLPDIYVKCDACQEKRYNRETLDVRYKNKNIHDVLRMTVEEALDFFAAIPAVFRRLQTLMDVGLGYIRLGQSATTLSGGEAQRVKLALELSKKDTGHTLYILDEPTTGLHFQDVELLLKVLQRLRDHGNTIVVIEHNLDVIKTADWIVDLGPEGGIEGGKIIASGTPEDIARQKNSYTGHYLSNTLKKLPN